MLVGGGVTGGVRWGKISAGGEEVEELPMQPRDFNAPIAYGLSTDHIVMSPGLRPFKVANKGQAEPRLFS